MAEPVSSPPFPSPSPAVPPASKESTNQLWYVGAIINVVGSVSINLGMNLMKLGHTKRAQLDMPEEEKPPIRKYKTWVIGIVIFITGNILNFVSFAFAAQSLLAALGSLQLVCNVFFANFFNHEPVTKLILLSTACIIGGCVLLVVFGNQSSEKYTVQQLIKFYTFPAYVVYLVMTAVFVFGFYIMYLHSKKVCRKRGDSGVWYFIMLVSYAVFSALLGSQSVLFGKSISVILRTTFSDVKQLANWYTWVVLPLFTLTALFWVTRLNKGLRMFPAMMIVPLLQIAWTLFSIIAGMLYFQEYKGFNKLKAAMFPVGVLIVFAGVFLLTICGKPPPEESEKALQAAEDGAVDDTQRTPKMSMYDNAMYSFRLDAGEGPPGDGAVHPHASKLSLGQTLRLMSTWAPPSVAVSPGSNLNRTLGHSDSNNRRTRRSTTTAPPSDLNATDVTGRTLSSMTAAAGLEAQTPGGGAGSAGMGPGTMGWGDRTMDPDSNLNRTDQSSTSRFSETSRLGSMRKGLKVVGARLTHDMGLDMSGFKLAVGLGDSALTGVSLFTMPALDFTATSGWRKPDARKSDANRAGAVPIDNVALSSLPRSRFYKGDMEGLTVIREASGVSILPRNPTTDLGASHSNSSQLPASSQDFHTATAAAAAGVTPSRSALAGGFPISTSNGHLLPEAAGISPMPPHQLPLPPSTSSTAQPISPSQKPLSEEAMLSLLPVPSFQCSRTSLSDTTMQHQQPQQLSRSPSDPRLGSAPGSPPRPGLTGLSQVPEVAGAAGSRGRAGGSSSPSATHEHHSRRPSTARDTSRHLPTPRLPSGPWSGQNGLTAAAGAPLHGSGGDSDGGLSLIAAPPPFQQLDSISVGVDGLIGSRGGSVSYDPAGAVTGSGGGGGGGGGAVRGARSIQPKPGSMGTLLPEGVPLSATNSVVLHESGANTPGEGGQQQQYQQQFQEQQQQQQQQQPVEENWPSEVHGSPAHSQVPPQQRPQRLQQQSPLRVHSPMTQPQPLQYTPQQLPISLLHHSAQSRLGGSVRLPALHLMVPGLLASPAPSPAVPNATSTMASSVHLPFGTSSVSYTELLAGRGLTQTGLLVAQMRRMGGSSSAGGAPVPIAGGILAPGSVQVQARDQSPRRGGLSVSRSWAGLAGRSRGGGFPSGVTSQQSPQQGSLVGQMQRPLRPWRQQ